jgi:hypothetical protein
MARLWFGVLLLGALAACETGYALDGRVVPEGGVDPTRQLVVLLSVDKEADLGQLLITSSTEGQKPVKVVDFRNAVDFYVDGGDLTGRSASEIIRLEETGPKVIRAVG